VPRDNKTALKWYTLAAEQGNVDAQTSLGWMYALGQGVAENDVYAYMWRHIAALSGDKDASDYRDEGAKAMSATDISTAQKLASECIRKKYKGCVTPQDGHGIHEYDDGSKYVGEWKDGERHGQGTYTFANGNNYVGEWKDGKRHGQGTFTWADGDKYVGQWKDDKYHGQGIYTRADGEKYVGEFKDSKRWTGTYYDKDGKVIATISEGVEKRVK
jgi:hypothetical protein